MELTLNPIAIAIAAISTFVIGGLWYSLLFAKPWQRLSGVSDEQLKSGAPRIFIGSFLLAVVMAVSLAAFIGSAGVGFGLFAGLASGLTFVAAAFGVNYLFERRPIGLFAINASYNVVAFTVMGLILGAMQAA